VTTRRWLGAVLALVLGTGVSACSGDTSVTPPTASALSADQTGQAQQAISRLQRALRDQDGSAAAAIGIAASREQLSAMVANIGTLHLSDIALRFVDSTAIDQAAADRLGPSAWEATVEVSYRLPGWDARVTRVETPFVFLPDAGDQRVAAVGAAGGRTPLWMAGPVRVDAGPRTLVISRAGDPARYARLAQHAVADVGKVLAGWHGTLVVEVPGSETELDQALDASQDQYANIAAVTASVDGSLVPGSPVHVFLNPRVFGGLGPRGSQVVLSHESTHVATRATFAELPTWLLEGFADYVALAHAHIPVGVAASQILARIRRDGAPDHLPTSDELAPTAHGLGATYEEAWLAARFVAQLYGEPKLVAFYDKVSAGTTATVAFRTVLGTSEAAFVKRWHADLTRLAGGQAG
jgi:hypothetical protein